MRHVIRAPEPPPRPLEEDDEREDENERDEFGELLPDLEEADEREDGDEADENEQPAPDTFDLDPPLEDATFEEQTAPDLRFGHDSVLPEDDGSDSDDASGFAAEPRTGETQPEDAFPLDDDERDGIDDFRPFVSELDIPQLDADEEGIAGESLRFGAFFAAAELAWPSARRPWRLNALAKERASALALGGGTVVAGSTDLLWLDSGRTTPVRIALDGTRITSLALLGDDSETVVAVTASGRLLRRTRLASDSERVGELGHGAHGALDVQGVELCALGRTEPRSLLRSGPSGLVERSDDAGASFAPIEPQLRALAITTTAAPFVALGDDARELYVSNDRGRSFEQRPLEGAAGMLARGEAPIVAAAERVVVLIEPELGLVVSTDEGRTFREVPGSAAATACSVGTYGGRAYAWVALYSEAADATRVLMVDVERAEAEVILTLSGAGDDDQLGASARLERLAWDGARLFAVGEPGFLSIEPPSLETHH
jgi:hypothetical protein